MLAVEGRRADVDERFLAELKWDGMRAMIHTDGRLLVVRNRSGEDVTFRYPELEGLGLAIGRPAIADGELVVLDAASRPSFGLLQRRMRISDARRARVLAGRTPVVWMGFDLLAHGDDALLDRPLTERRERLESLGLASAAWRTPQAHDDIDTLIAVAADLELEGIVAKRRTSRYQPGRRSPDWRKLKRAHRQEFVVGGLHHGHGTRRGTFGSVLVGYHDDHGLRFAGAVGGGFDDAELRMIRDLVRPIDHNPFVDPPPQKSRTFVAPTVVVEVRFSGWTHDGHLRHPVYLGLRADVDAASVRREGPPSTGT